MSDKNIEFEKRMLLDLAWSVSSASTWQRFNEEKEEIKYWNTRLERGDKVYKDADGLELAELKTVPEPPTLEEILPKVEIIYDFFLKQLKKDTRS